MARKATVDLRSARNAQSAVPWERLQGYECGASVESLDRRVEDVVAG